MSTPQDDNDSPEGTPTSVNLIRFGASRDEIIAHLDAHPEWERRALAAFDSHHVWQLALPPTDPYSRIYTGVQGVSVKIPTASMSERLGAHYLISECAEAAHTINAIALRMWPETDEEIVARIAAAYQALDPDHPAALILSGRTIQADAISREQDRKK